MCGPLSVHTVCSKSGWLCFTVLQSCVAQRNGGRERWWGMGGNRKMSRGVNTETGVWLGTMIRFIIQAMLFSLLGDCCKTLSANWSSQCPTAETRFPPSPSLESLSSSPVFPHISSYLSSASLLPFPLFPWAWLDFLPRVRPRWIGLESILSASITLLVFSPPQSGVCHPSTPCLPRPLAGAHNIQYFLQLEWNWAH